MSFECEFCKKTFSTKGNLKIHQTKTKYCLEIQNKNGNKEYCCEYCKKDFVTKSGLDKHIKNCIEYYKYIIRDQNKRINKLESYLIKNTDYFVTNTDENEKSLLELLLSDINDKIKNNFNSEYLIEGQKGIAKFVFDHILKDIDYSCIDNDRYIFLYKTGDSSEKDVKAKKLVKLLFQGDLKKIGHSISCEKMKSEDSNSFLEYTEHYNQLVKFEYKNNVFCDELIKLLS